MRTIECPNCGAPATNLQNCNFCGSLLVRFADKGIDLSRTSYLSNDAIIPGLVEQLEKNLNMQASAGNAGTDLYIKGSNSANESLCFVTSASIIGFQDDELAFPNANGNSLATVFRFDIYQDNSIDPIAIERHNKFKTLPSFPLFTSHTTTGDDSKGNTLTAYEYAIDFGKDAEGTAKLISEIANKVYGLDITQPIDCYTSKYEDLLKHRLALGIDTTGEDGEMSIDLKKWIWIGVAIACGLIALMI